MRAALFDLTGKSALVTGGARGIGKAISAAFLEHGASVVIGDIDEAEAARTARELTAKLAGGHAGAGGSPPPRCVAVPLDVTSEASIARAVQETLAALGRIDILVNNAGINTVRDRVTIEKYRVEDWRKILSVDLDGVFLVSRPVVEHMKASGSGRIINVSSVLGLVPARLQSAYVAAKAAVVNLTKSMALELAPAEILVNAIAPGSTLTDGTRQLFYSRDGSYSQKAQSLLSHIPLARPAEPEEIAAVAVFLAAPASSYVTGVALPVDGGWTAGYIRDW